MKFRKLTVADAENFWEMTNQLDHETNYLLFEPGERKRNIPRTEEMIQSSAEKGNFLLVAEADDKIVGYITARKGDANRKRHSAYITVGILRDYRGQGIGTEFFKQLDIWAEEQNIRRLELTVVCENTIAQGLYKKSGFEIEGVKRMSVLVNGKFLDEYYMSKLK